MKYLTLDEIAQQLADKYAATGTALKAELVAAWGESKQTPRQREAEEAALAKVHKERIRGDLIESLTDAVRAGKLIARDPVTKLPRSTSKPVRSFYGVVSLGEADAWLKASGSPYRLGSDDISPLSFLDVARGYATRAYRGLRSDSSAPPTREEVAKEVAHLMNEAKEKDKKGRTPGLGGRGKYDAEYIRRHVLDRQAPDIPAWEPPKD